VTLSAQLAGVSKGRGPTSRSDPNDPVPFMVLLLVRNGHVVPHANHEHAEVGIAGAERGMTAGSLVAALARIGQVQPRLSGTSALLLAIVAVCAMLPGIWLVTRHITVIAHEGAHATVGSALGRRVMGVSFRPNADGATAVSGGGGPGSAVIAAVGYLGPSAFGVGAAELIHTGHIVAVLWFALVALVWMMFVLRRGFGILTVIVAFALLLLLASVATVSVQVDTAYTLTWFLLASGVRIVVTRGARAVDAGILSDITRIPRGVWYAFWLLSTAAALAFGATLLL
jgi:Peptidase M50B-like